MPSTSQVTCVSSWAGSVTYLEDHKEVARAAEQGLKTLRSLRLGASSVAWQRIPRDIRDELELIEGKLQRALATPSITCHDCGASAGIRPGVVCCVHAVFFCLAINVALRVQDKQIAGPLAQP